MEWVRLYQVDRSREKYSKWKGNMYKCIETAKTITTKKELLIVYFIHTKNMYSIHGASVSPTQLKKQNITKIEATCMPFPDSYTSPTPPRILNSLCFPGGIVSVELLRYRIWSSSTLQDNAKLLSKWVVSIYVLTSRLVCIFTNS